MSLAERIDRLEPRERQLLGIFVVVVGVFVLLLVPIGVTALVSSKRSTVEGLRGAIDSINTNRTKIADVKTEHDQIVSRYARKTPSLAGFLESKAKAAGIEIPESQDRASVPHGKRYEERSTKITLRKVGMLNLVKFMEGIERSGYPVFISRLNIRKRGTESDSFDVEMVVNAMDRNAKASTKKTPASDKEEG